MTIFANIGIRRDSHPPTPAGTRASMRMVENNLHKVIEAAERAAVPAMLSALRPIYEESQKLVPVDTGKLRNSGYLLHGGVGSQGVVLGYGAHGDPEYAVAVHERTDAQHDGGQAKFLEEPVYKRLHSLLGDIADYMRTARRIDSPEKFEVEPGQ